MAGFGQDLAKDFLTQKLTFDTQNLYIKNTLQKIESLIEVSFVGFETRRFAIDEITDGQSFSAYGFFTITNLETVQDIALRVANVEPILYDNLFALYSNKENIDNPFYKPIIPPNNIQGENGYGVFAGYQLQETIINY